MVVPPSFDYDDPTAHSPKRRRSRKKQQSSPRSLKGTMKQQQKSRRNKRGSSDNASTYTKSTASASGEWSNGSLKSSISSLKSSVSSLGTMGMNSPGGHYITESPGGGRVLMEPLNDLGMGSHHERASHSSLLSPSHSERDRSHSSILSASSNQPRERDSVTSLGESSLSSFLSVLLEDEEAKPSEISIVSDNPKPEQKSVRDLRLSFIRSAYNSDKPKCRWEYLTRDNNDREKLARSTRRSKLETRSLSFSGAINETKQRLRRCSSNGSMNSVNSNNSKKKVSDAVAGMFLRMPVRKNSPMSAAATKKSLMSRVNMSDTDLVLLPMQPGTSSMTPKKTKRRSSRSSRSSRKSDKKSNSKSLDEPESPQPKGLSRSGDRKANNKNATWSKEDTMRERRRRNSNEFLDFLLEPESDNKSGWPSPIPSPAFASPRKLALGISQRQLEGLSPSVFSLGDDSSSSSSYEEDLKAIEIAAKKIPAPKRSSFSKQSNIKKYHPRRSSECSQQSSSGRTYHSTIRLKGERTPEKCSSRPPQLPTRLKTPTTLYNSPSRKSPRATIRKNKNKKLTLPTCLPLSPRSPRSSSKKSVSSKLSKKSIASNPTDSPLSSPRTPTSKKSVVTTIRQRLSSPKRSPKKIASPKKSPKKIASKTEGLPKAPVGKWYSPFDYDMNMDG